MPHQAKLTKVLMVEDDPIAAEILKSGLDALGCSVTIAASGEEAMHILQSDHEAGEDCLLADIVLPGPVDGWTVGNEFRLKNPTAPVVFISAYEQKDRSRQPYRSTFLSKPVRPAQILELLRSLGTAA